MKNILILIIIYLFSTAISYSQCGCLGGAAVGGLTPIGGTANVGLLREDYLRSSLFYSYANGNQFYRGASKTEKDLQGKRSFQGFHDFRRRFKNERDLCLEAGCDEYIPKPIKTKTLLETISKLID